MTSNVQPTLRSVADAPIGRETAFSTQQFVSMQRSHKITLLIDDATHSAMIESMEIDPSEPVELALLLREIIAKLVARDQGRIDTIVQQILLSDWEQSISKIKFFEYVDTSDEHGYVIAKIKTNCFAHAVMCALGFEF